MVIRVRINRKTLMAAVFGLLPAKVEGLVGLASFVTCQNRGRAVTEGKFAIAMHKNNDVAD
ncbi:MAG: hypothetical protein WDN06_21600 [Asticcacaulis sp.]